jgi:hypothetical protein
MGRDLVEYRGEGRGEIGRHGEVTMVLEPIEHVTTHSRVVEWNEERQADTRGDLVEA